MVEAQAGQAHKKSLRPVFFPVPRVEDQTKSGKEHPTPCTALVCLLTQGSPSFLNPTQFFIRIAYTAVFVFTLIFLAFNPKLSELRHTKQTPSTQQMKKDPLNTVDSTEEEIDPEFDQRDSTTKTRKTLMAPVFLSKVDTQDLVGEWIQ